MALVTDFKDITKVFDKSKLNTSPEKMSRENIGALIKGKRIKKKYTQGFLAEILSVSVIDVFNWENDIADIPEKIIGHLCHVLQIEEHQISNKERMIVDKKVYTLDELRKIVNSTEYEYKVMFNIKQVRLLLAIADAEERLRTRREFKVEKY